MHKTQHNMCIICAFCSVVADPASQVIQCYSGKLTQVPLSMRVIELLHKEGLITEESKMSAERSAGHLTSMTDFLKCVSEDHGKLRTLGSILSQSEEGKSLGEELLLEYYCKRQV